MRPFKLTHTIDAPREGVFDYLSDVAHYGEFCDHFLGELRLERLESRGRGAALRFRVEFPLGRQWGDLVLSELERPYRIVARGRGGRAGRIELEASFTLTTAGQGMTLVEFRFATSPPKHVDRVRASLGLRWWLKLQGRRALRRLASAIETGRSSTRPIGAAAG